MENVYEQFFILKHYGAWSLIELYNLPVGLREWWLNRTVQEYEKEKEANEKASKKIKATSKKPFKITPNYSTKASNK